MHNHVPPEEARVVPAPQGENQDAAYVEGVATGCLGCLSAVVLAILGFVTGYSLVGHAHEHEWFYTQEEFKNRHGLSGFGMAFFSNLLMGGFVGAVLLPVTGAAVYVLIRSSKNAFYNKPAKTQLDSSRN